MYAEVAVNSGAPHRDPFTYHVPPGLRVEVGSVVYVPFGIRRLQGVVLRLSETTEIEATRPISEVVDGGPIFDAPRATLAFWLSREYIAPLFACVSLLAPPGFGEAPRTVVRLVADVVGGRLSAEAQRAAEVIRAEGGSLEVADLAKRLGKRSAAGLVAQLERAGLARKETTLRPPRVRPRHERFIRATGRLLPVDLPEKPKEAAIALLAEGPQPAVAVRRRFGSPTIRKLIDLDALEEYRVVVERDPLAALSVDPKPPAVLTSAQEQALARVRQALVKRSGQWLLLHGVTGSGKTEVYLAALAEVVADGGRGIVLVPDISLTPQTVRRFLERFPGRVAVLHSGLSDGERFDQWHAIRDGRFDVVVGARSAIFAPMPDLRLVVIDEEHEWTYKQDELAPRYDARRVATELARGVGAVTLSGSATPDVASYFAAKTLGALVELPNRVIGQTGTGVREPARVDVVDLGQELSDGHTSIFSRLLQECLGETLRRGEQAILFLNRRGAASQLLCRDCGEAPTCPSCGVTYTVHDVGEMLVCHWCGRKRRLPSKCPACGSNRLRRVGVGTQRVEQEVRDLFPGARPLRWDRDVTRKRGDHDRILAAFASGEHDILIGTQMVAKGHDLPRVATVGVVLADLSLTQPDFRASERTFQLLTQVAGRAGRRGQASRVVIQTYRPDHPAVERAAQGDYEGFYTEEIDLRARAGYPPFGRLAQLVFQHVRRIDAEGETHRMLETIRTEIRRRGLPGMEVHGPVVPFVERLRGRYRRALLVRGPDPVGLLERIVLPEGWSVDVDPSTLL